MHLFRSPFGLRETVYHVNNGDPDTGPITGITFTADGGLMYSVSWGPGQDSRHYGCELSRTHVPDFARGAGGEDAEVPA
jgi:hypothetical protein